MRSLRDLAPRTTTVEAVVSRLVPAPTAVVWALQAHAARWTQWHPDVSYVDAPDAPLDIGVDFEWVWRGTPVHSSVTQAARGRVLAWDDASARGWSEQRWRFEPHPDGGATTVTVTGRLAWMAGPRPAHAVQHLLCDALDRWLDGLAAVAATGPRAAP